MMQPTERLAELIRQKRLVLTHLRDSGRRQTDLVAGGDIASLLNLLATKQTLIASLQTLERELAPYYAEESESRIWKSPEARAHCAQQVAECNALLEEIVRMEKHGAEQITARKNEVAQQLQQVHSATQVRGAYEAHRIQRAS